MASIRKLKSGNYQVQIRLFGLRPIVRSFSTKKKSQEFARQVEGDTELARKLGSPVIQSLSFKELVDKYMDQYLGKDPSTLGRLDYWIDRFGEKQVIQVDEFDVDDGLVELAKTRTGSTVNRYKSTLSSVFIFFIQHPDYKKLGYTNPVRKESVSRYSENQAKQRFLIRDEQEALLSASKKANWGKFYLVVLLAITTGARKGEILNLKWSDIDFQNRTALLAVTKNGKPRLIPLTQPVIAELMKYRERSDFLIFHNTVSRTSPFDISKSWATALKVSGIGHCRFHDLRHTAASNLVKSGRSLFEVGTLLGHSSTSMTARYAHLAIEDTRNMVDSVMGELR
jgi:integrase